jgi:hypothetical protein
MWRWRSFAAPGFVVQRAVGHVEAEEFGSVEIEDSAVIDDMIEHRRSPPGLASSSNVFRKNVEITGVEER